MRDFYEQNPGLIRTKICHLTAFLIAAKSQGSEMVEIVEMVTHILPPGI